MYELVWNFHPQKLHIRNPCAVGAAIGTPKNTAKVIDQAMASDAERVSTFPTFSSLTLRAIASVKLKSADDIELGGRRKPGYGRERVQRKMYKAVEFHLCQVVRKLEVHWCHPYVQNGAQLRIAVSYTMVSQHEEGKILSTETERRNEYTSQMNANRKPPNA